MKTETACCMEEWTMWKWVEHSCRVNHRCCRYGWTPAAVNGPAKVWDAIVPVVVAVAAPIKIPERGVKTTCRHVHRFKKGAIISTCTWKLLIIPAMVPVRLTELIRQSYKTELVNSTVFFALPVTTIVTKPPRGSDYCPRWFQRLSAGKKGDYNDCPSMAFEERERHAACPASSIPSNSCAPPF